jgi:hypothetical protein
MFDAFPWKTDTEKDTENVQTKLINLQRDTNITFSQTKLQKFLFALAEGHIPSTQVLN